MNIEMGEYNYIGSELDLFAKATRWKSYCRSFLASVISGDVLEVGAGIGSNTLVFAGLPVKSWTCLEPDLQLCARIPRELAGTFINGTIADLPAVPSYDTIVYIDVLEHIEDDKAELEGAFRLLRKGGHLCVLAPAHQKLFNAFDAAIGHYRRYSKESLKAAGPPNGHVTTLAYLDCAGVLASIGNRILLRQATPTERQIAAWDRYLVPISRRLDPVLRFTIGKSIVGVWKA
jgi:SAM-dependent methyltransferase